MLSLAAYVRDMDILRPVGEFGYLFWRLLLNLRYCLHDRKRIFMHLDQIGVRSIPLILLIGLFAGGTVAWQAAYQFKGMVSLSVLGGQVVRVLMMEMAPVLTALVISGRTGASMAAEIGSMKVTEQIDALHTLSIDPVRYIVLPRFVGLAIMMPILTLFSLSVAVFGSFFVSAYFLNITYQVFFASVRDFFQIGDLTGGMIKGIIFGMMIALIGCYKGLSTSGGAKGVGDSTIAAFVVCAVSVLAADFLLWIILF
jgi:phospholipid/cholesterol/gamma-HCH transport system permease protein